MKRQNVKIKCPYCGSLAQLRPASALNKLAPGYAGKRFYVCSRYPACNSYVEAHASSGLPMGRLANQSLRWKRREAHKALERLWLQGYMSKPEAYRWLQMQMGLPAEDAHIALFSEYRCNEVIRLCGSFGTLRNAA